MSKEIYLTNSEMVTEYGEPKLRLYGRNDNGGQETVTVEGKRPYFYVPSGHGVSKSDNSDIVGIESGYESLFGDDLDKIVVRNQGAVREVGELFEETYESDVWYTNRCRIDMGLYSGVEVPSSRCGVNEVNPIEKHGEPLVMTIDIETDDRGDFPEMGEKRVLSIAAHDSRSDEYVLFIDLDGRDVTEAFPNGKPSGIDRVVYTDTETKMFKKFSGYMSDVDPDLLTGWYFADFDMPYIVERMKELGVDPDRLSREGDVRISDRGDVSVKGRTVMDMLEAYKSIQWGELESYKLDDVAEEELGDAKIDHTGEGFFEMYQENTEKFAKYNVHDVRLVVEIEESADILGFKGALKDEVGVDFEGTKNNHTLIEMFARRKLSEKGLVGPDARHDHDYADYEGGHVESAYTGVAENVVGVDLASLYPYTMKMFNMSPETKLEGDSPGSDPGGNVVTSPSGTAFSLEEEGIFAELVDEAIGLKSDYKEDRNAATPGTDEHERLAVRYMAAKTITNSLYGVLGWEHFFLYDRDVARSVTLAGQACIKETKRFFEEETSGTVIYGDTDSNYVAFPSDWHKEYVIKEVETHCNDLNDLVYPEFSEEEFGVPRERCLWEIEPEVYAKRFFQHGKKKRYAMLTKWIEGKDVDKVKITGYQRSDVSPLTQDLIDDVLTAIVHGKSNQEISSLVHDAATEIEPEMGDLTRIGIPGGLGKALEDYAWTNGSPQGAHPRAAYNANELLSKNYGEGDKPKRVYLNDVQTEIGNVEVIGFEEDGDLPDELRRIDVSRMTQTAIVNPLDDILSAVDIDVSAATKGQVQNGLSAYM